MCTLSRVVSTSYWLMECFMNLWKLLLVAMFSMSTIAVHACGGDGDEECSESTEDSVEASPAPTENGCGCSH